MKLIKDLVSIGKKISSGEEAFELYQNVVNNIFSLSPDVYDESKYLSNLELVNILSNEANLFVSLFDIKKLKLIWHSSNYEVLMGLTENEIKSPILTFFKQMKLSHTFLLPHFSLVATQFLNSVPLKLKQEYVGVQFIGFELIHPKTGQKHQIILREYGIELDKNGNPTLYLLMIEDATHLLKSQRPWARIDIGKSERKVCYLQLGDLTGKHDEIFTEREIEILRLISRNKETDEIASELFLSNHTVEKHRKNMLNKTGVKHTLGLVELAKKIRII